MVRQIAKSAGLPDLRIVEYPAPIALDDAKTMKKYIRETVAPGVMEALTKPVKSTVKKRRRGPSDRDVIFEGSFEEVQDFFYEKQWTDGLPVIPPTVEKVEEFLKYTDRGAEEILGVLEPAMGTLNVWNVAGSLPGSTDMATHGQMFRCVAPENDEVCHEIGWPTLSETRGFSPDENVVTIVSGRAQSDPLQTNGEEAGQHLDYITDWVERMIEPYEAMRGYMEDHVLFLSPVVAKLLASEGYTKEDVDRYLHEHAKVTAEYFEKNSSRFNNWKPYSIKEEVEAGRLPGEWLRSDDPGRLVPLLGPNVKTHVLVTGDVTRNRSVFHRSNYTQGKMTSRAVKLPKCWDELLRKRRG